ncbi:MAG TPA: hypothetical protein PK668_21585 [Myxococcota bacterium]|nr:hypothetical protein [Myxococcota bacterium]HRY96071.1 hypothetical protein [Myxococcota bacterium]
MLRATRLVLSGFLAATLLMACGGEDEECVPLPSPFNADTTLPAGCYLATESPVIADGVTLTLSPGVKIIFSDGVELGLSGTRALVAVGTQDDPILLTGATQVRGSWTGLVLTNATAANRLDWVIVEYAGGTAAIDNAAVTLDTTGEAVRLQMDHTTVRESSGFGLYLCGRSEVASFTGNTLTRNALGPAHVFSESARLLDASSTFTGNDRDEVVVTGNQVPVDATWQTLDVPYYLDSSVNVTAALTFQPGATVIFAPDTFLAVADDAGALHAVGTEADPILFTGATRTRGSWSGITFSNTANPQNALDHVTVEYGGGPTAQGGAAVMLDSTGAPVRVTIDHTTIQESGGFGLYLAKASEVPSFTGNTLTGNTLGPAYVFADSAEQLDASSAYTGNDRDEIVVNGDWVTEDGTWQALDVPYHVTTSINVGAVLTLAAGATLIFDADLFVSVNGDVAALHAVGTEAAPILFTAATPTNGFWSGLVFPNTNNAANRLEYVTVEYGGSAAVASRGNVDLYSTGLPVRLTMSHCTLRHSAAWGLWQDENVTLDGDWATTNTYEDNASGDVGQP